MVYGDLGATVALASEVAISMSGGVTLPSL